MTRRYVYDEVAGRVVEVGVVRGAGLSPREQYRAVAGDYQHEFNRAPSTGERLRIAALQRADRREWAHKKFGTETRWAE